MPEIPSLGSRGEGWVVFQFVLMGAVFVAGWAGPGWPDSVAGALSAVGAALVAVGGVAAVLAGRALGKSLTPFPRPARRGDLVERGPYRVVRHPLYAAGLLCFAGFSLAFSPLALLATGLLALVWALKSAVEERFLLEARPGYAEYCARTRYRLVPFVY